MTDSAKKIMDNYLNEVAKLEKKIGKAQRIYDNVSGQRSFGHDALCNPEPPPFQALSRADTELQNANNARLAAMKAANAALVQASTSAQNSINSAIQSLESARNFLNTHFGRYSCIPPQLFWELWIF